MSNSRRQNDEAAGLDRRELIGRVGRLVGLGGLGALLVRSAFGPETPDGAVPLCTECPALRGCGRRDGIVTRRAMAIERERAESGRRELCAELSDESDAVRRNT
jgi:hypothetical protein